jgi:putative ABC transport system substrate-binding protein
MRRVIAALTGTVFAFTLHLPSAGPPYAQAPKAPLVGVLASSELEHPSIAGFRQGLRELGYVEGRNIRLEYRTSGGRFDSLAELAADILRLSPDVMVAIHTPAALAVKSATASVPIVVVAADPVAVGLVTSLARPGGNITGIATQAADLVGKQIELLKELDPGLSRAAVLWNPANVDFQALQAKEAETAARRTGVQLHFIAAGGPGDFEGALATMRGEGIRTLLVLTEAVYRLHRDTLVEQVARDRIVAVSGFREFAEAGGLIAYGPSFFTAGRRTASYLDKVLKGARPADLPVEQPMGFELVVNLKAAKKQGVTIPPSILARADEVIE